MTDGMPKKSPEKSASFDRMKDAVDRVHLFGPEPAAPVVGTVTIEAVDAWQIVVVGAIDPRQHYPQWYHQIECITESELTSAVKDIKANLPPPAPGVPQQSFCEFNAGRYF
jgi:hypothetical protein